MIDQKIRDILCQIRDKAAQNNICASFCVHREKSHLMRIGNNSVSLNTSENLTRLDIEVFDEYKTGTHTQMGDINSVDYVQKALDSAVEKCAVASDKSYKPIIPVIRKQIDETSQYDKSLEQLDPAFKAENYKKIIDTVGEKYNYSGSWSSGSVEVYLVTTENKKEACHLSTDQDFNIVLKHPEKKWELIEKQSGWKKDSFNAEQAINNFKALLAIYEEIPGIKLEPGEYTVAFGDQALAEILMMAKYTGLGGRSWEEKQGWTSDKKIGDKILGDNFSVTDDPANDETFRFGFDFDGSERKNFPVIENGVLKGLMYDSSTAARFNKPLTGHTIGSVSLVMHSGKDASDILQAVKDYDKVLFIPALHYLNIPNPAQGIFTGSSRFNAVLIEKGKISGPIFSSRVTDSFTNVFSNITRASSKSNSVNLSNTYGRRMPVAYSVPEYLVAEKVKITDSADSF